MQSTYRKSFNELKNYVENVEFKGWDPYDGLNSKIFQTLPFFKNHRVFRLIWIQLFKRSPINFRKHFFVPKEYNAKGLGLFLSGYCNLYKSEPNPDSLQKINFISDQIINLISKNYSGACWGYNFDWQARAFFQPKGTPTIVASSFIGCALFDAYDITGRMDLYSTAVSIKDFILKDLNRTYDDSGDFAFSYSPIDKTQVYNASLLGAKILSRIFSYTNEEELVECAKKAVSFCCKAQKSNGAWSYGTLPHHQWIDSFHTGYNLECLSEYMKHSSDESFKNNLKLGYQYYINTFFKEDGRSKYYNNKVFPIDIHSPAQLIPTLVSLNRHFDNQEIIKKVLKWTIENMQDNKGYFYYQIKNRFTSKIPYIRWAQAWMFYALSIYLTKFED